MPRLVRQLTIKSLLFLMTLAGLVFSGFQASLGKMLPEEVIFFVLGTPIGLTLLIGLSLITKDVSKVDKASTITYVAILALGIVTGSLDSSSFILLGSAVVLAPPLIISRAFIDIHHSGITQTAGLIFGAFFYVCFGRVFAWTCRERPLPESATKLVKE